MRKPKSRKALQRQRPTVPGSLVAASVVAACWGLTACGQAFPRTVSPTPAMDQTQRSPSIASPEPPPSATPINSADAAAESTQLARALLARLTVWTRHDGTTVLARYCRTAAVSCEARVTAFATMFVDAGRRFGLDPILLAALALHESNLNPAAVGPLGTAGIMQLHPRGVGKGEPFVESESFREECLTLVDACQQRVVWKASSAIAAALDDCGSLESALSRYATGRCGRAQSYLERLGTEIDTLRMLLGT